MKIVCIQLAPPQSDEPQSPNNQAAESSVFPVSFVGVIMELMAAGHKVNWLEQPLCPSSVDEAISQVAAINPEVLFFACDGRPTLPLMATVAVRYNGLDSGEYICDGVLRSANQWCTTLTSPDLSVLSLIDKIQQFRKAKVGHRALNDSCSVSSAENVP